MVEERSPIVLSRSSFDLDCFTSLPVENKSKKNVKSEYILIDQSESILKNNNFTKQKAFIKKSKLNVQNDKLMKKNVITQKEKGYIREKRWCVSRIQISILKMKFFAVYKKNQKR